MRFATQVRSVAAATLASLLLAPAAQADSGFYLGAAIGQANITSDFDVDEFDENATAWKAIGGYIWDFPVIEFGVELAYNDFGKADGDVDGINTEIDATAISGFGVFGLEFGIFGIFGKAGFAQWDADIAVEDVVDISDDGTDPAYGLGLRLNFGSIELRGEYEYFDVSEADDVDMLSLGLVWRF